MKNNLIKIEIAEDDMNNLLIDLWKQMNVPQRNELKKQLYPYATFKNDGSVEISESEKPQAITITIKK